MTVYVFVNEEYKMTAKIIADNEEGARTRLPPLPSGAEWTRDYDPHTCILCGKRMRGSTIPYWIIDPESLEVKGIAHKTCRDKLDEASRSMTTHVGFWRASGPPLSDPPSREIIEFTARMIRYRKSLPKWETDVDFKVIMLMFETFKASNVEEFLELPKMKKFFDWWCNPEQRNPMPKQELEEIKRRLRENLGETS